MPGTYRNGDEKHLSELYHAYDFFAYGNQAANFGRAIEVAEEREQIWL